MAKTWEKIRTIWHYKDLRNAILYVLGMLAIFRIAAHIPLPGVNIEALKNFFAQNQVFGLLNILSGGAMERFSIVAMGVAPYITASIIFQLLTMVIPSLEALSKEGQTGYQKINQYTRIATVPLAALQAYALITLLSRSGQGIINLTGPKEYFLTIITLTAGTMFLMWLGELVSEKRVGNGISLLIFAGIVADLPTNLQRTLLTFEPAQIANLIVLIVLGVITIAGVVILNEGQRNIPVSYARRIRGMRMYGGTDTYLPLRVNQAGMIPIIFAISLILFPPLVGQFLSQVKNQAIATGGKLLVHLFQNQIFYGFLYFVLVVAFTYFYTSIIFKPDQIADHLQKQGGFVPGLRPGRNTAEYLSKISSRIMLAGALSLGIIAILPLITQGLLKISALTIGGASLLIVVSVVIETVKQIEAQIAMREYEK
ncbi:MAG: preprotein translocase subunit SecY [Patescibacteria group bacterium]|nr:preprotein translocase subunit SecY [Patescibacteria group bacterium]